jgi:hypothetical protein
MKPIYLLLTLLLNFAPEVQSQSLSASQLLDKAISYHDPKGTWLRFNDSLHVVMTTPNGPNRDSRILINLPKEYFSVTALRDGNTTFYEISKGNCRMIYNGELVDEETAKTSGLSCDRAELYKNYYTYLYGLPMKLNDPGTNIDHPVEKKTFKGKEYLVIKATYEASVGSDVWFFYFNPSSYAMEIYQFYKTDAKGSLIPDSGEYIILEGLADIGSIRMPKVRSWYYNKNDELLGTDTLIDQ